MKKVVLTHEGIRRIGYFQDFILRTDNSCDQIKCSKSQISFISPVIHNLLLSDITLSEFKLKTHLSSKCSELIRSLLNGSTVLVPPELVKTFDSIMFELGNEEVFRNINEELTIENVIEVLQTKNIKSLNIDREIEFIASNFHKIHASCSYLDVSIIDCILSSKSLVVNSEHDLFTFICDLMSLHGDKYRFLLSHLHLEYLVPEDISFVMSYISEDNIGLFLPSIYRCIMCPFDKSKTLEEDRSRYKRSNGLKVDTSNNVLINFNGDKFDGIFSHLWNETNGNPVINGTVGIKETTNYSNSTVYYLVDPEKRNKGDWCCATYDTPKGAFIIDFHEKRVCLNGYSLKAHGKQWSSRSFIKSWRIEGSNDKVSWHLIDEQKNSTALQSYFKEGHWSCTQSPPFRYFRIKMIERNTEGEYQMSLNAIELFGMILK